MTDEGLADVEAANPFGTQTSSRNWFALHDLDGSLAPGDFAAPSSDSDVLVVAEDVLSDKVVAALVARHARLATRPTEWARELSVSYIPRSVAWGIA
jgi:hypothetical protein